MKKRQFISVLAGILMCILFFPAQAFAAETVSIGSCLINGDTIQITASKAAETAAGDGKLYLFELKPYETSIGDRTDYVAESAIAQDMSFQVPLNHQQANTRLYSGFVTAVYNEGRYEAVSGPSYVTNPEVLAPHTAEIVSPASKKGLLIDENMLNDVKALGLKHVLINITLDHIIRDSGIEYTYNGKTYHFNKGLIEKHDRTVTAMTEQGIEVTAVILNGWNPATPYMFYPGATKEANAFYYSFHTTNPESVETIRAVTSFLAERYSGANGKGKIANWIFGNEINNQAWNYMGGMDVTKYVEEYEKAFRVFYTTVKSINKNDRVYFSIDYNWNLKDVTDTNYRAQAIVDTFNDIVKKKGQMDWGLSHHPYGYPFSEPEFWNDRQQTTWITDAPSTRIINFNNLNVLTDYFQKPELLTKDGQVRSIILSEQGFTSNTPDRGIVEDIQAAAIAYAYYIAEANPHIDSLIMSRQTDAGIEASDYGAFGLWARDFDAVGPGAVKKKMSWEVYKKLDTPESLAATEFAKTIIGINSWEEAIPGFRLP